MDLGGIGNTRENAKGKIEENKTMGKSENGKMKEDKRNNIGPNIHIRLITNVKPQLYMSMQLSVSSAQSIGLALSVCISLRPSALLYHKQLHIYSLFRRFMTFVA